VLQKIWAAIVAFFLCLFPWLQPMHSLSAETVANNLMQAIATEDIKLFEEQLSLNLKVNLLKENNEDLSDKIAALFNAIDGEVVSVTWKTMGGVFERDRSGRSIRQQTLYIEFSTTGGNYELFGGLEYANNFAPKELGMRSIVLLSSPSYTELAQIRATHGEVGLEDR